MKIMNLSFLSIRTDLARLFNQVWWFLAFFWLSFNAFAEEKAEGLQKNSLLSQPAEPSDYFGKIMLSLVFILLIIFVSAWLIKRFGSFTGLPNVNMRILGALSVGQKERIVLLQVGKEQLVIGVTPAEITMLHQLAEPIEFEQATPLEGSFAKRMQEALAQTRVSSSKDSAKESRESAPNA